MEVRTSRSLGFNPWLLCFSKGEFSFGSKGYAFVLVLGAAISSVIRT